MSDSTARAPSAPFADLDRARAYLPPGFLEARPPTDDTLRLAQTQLAVVLRAVTTYLPRQLVRTELGRLHLAPQPARGEFLHGALAFADISGFTALSERLGALGREGAEQITEVVNRYFKRMLGVVFAHGGDVFKFGGDALLVFYPDGAVPGIVTALTASWHMQQAMHEFEQVKTSVGSFPLRMKIGLNTGPVFTARLGTVDDRQFIVTGGAVNATARAESLSFAGEILLTPQARAALDHTAIQANFISGPEGHFLLQALPKPPVVTVDRPPLPEVSTLPDQLAALDRLAPYLPHGLLPRLVSDPARLHVGGEHRWVGVLFCNYLGMSDLIDRPEPDRPDDIAARLNRYITAMHAAISRYGGVINKIDLHDHGDKLMALFGAPIAHEDDAERTLRAALDMQAQAGELQPLTIRQAIGINAGVVFAGHVGSDERREYTVMGDDVNLAARLMSAARPGEVLLSNAIRRKVAALFELVDRGAVRVKGKSQPVPIFAVERERARPEAVRGIRGLHSPLVGRLAAEQTLSRLAAEVRSGHGRILTLIGEAGVGKSRLIDHLRITLSEGDCRCYESHCPSYTQTVSYAAFLDIVRAMLGLTPLDSEAEAWSKLRRYSEEQLPPELGEDILPYLAAFLSLPLPAPLAERVAYLEGETLQRQVIRAVTTLIEQAARRHVMLLVFDDLHWADSASLVMLERVLGLVERTPILIALLYRPERAHGSWALGELAARAYPAHHTHLTLAPLSVAAGEDCQLVRNLLSMDEVPPSLIKLIGRAEGNPFYIEEIIRVLIDLSVIVRRGDQWVMAGELAAIAVPDSLHGLIMARIDRLLEEARRTLQIASVVGRTFHYLALSWLARAAELAGHLDASLSDLQRAELIRELARVPDVEYGFAQAMFRDVAYESLLVRDRRIFHRLAGEQLEDSYPPEQREEVYELLAHHYGLSDDREKALAYLIKAADKTRLAYANAESINFYRQAALLADRLGTADDNAAVAEGLGDVLYHVGEYDDALACYQRALAFRDTPPARADLYRRIGAVHEKRGQYDSARQACAAGIDLLRAEHGQSVEMARLLTLECRVHHQQGQFEQAIADGEQALAIVEDSAHYREIAQAHNWLGNAYVGLGQIEQAIAHLERGLVIMERIGDEHGSAHLYNNLAHLLYQTDPQRSAAYVTNYLETMKRLGDVWGESTGYQNLGVIRFSQGDYRAAIELYHRSLQIKQRLTDSLGIADCYINLGEASRALGDTPQAIDYLEKALELAQQIGARQAEAECHRQLAACYLDVAEPERALAAGREALEDARLIGDRSEEAAIEHVMGTALMQIGDLPAARSRLEHSCDLLRELNLEIDLCAVLQRLAQVLIGLDRPADAERHLREALDLAEKLDLQQEQINVRQALSSFSQE